jgi:fumarate hydratase class I
MVIVARKLALPLSEADVRSLSAGQMVLLSGMLVTGRDRLHKFLFHERPPREALPFPMEGSVLYHTGPVVKDDRIIAAGPTTSMRVEMYEPWVIEHYGLRGVMGKGGMGPGTLEALGRFGCVYLNAIGGAAACLADRIKRIAGSWKLEEFGAAEAMWLLEVEDFPAVVTMDAHGRSLHADIERASRDKLLELIGAGGG